MANAPPHLELAFYDELFVVIDDGKAPPGEYEDACRALLQHAAEHPSCLGCLIIVPADAAPPSEEARDALNAALENIAVRCVCWVVEGSGFHAAMVRAVLTGLRVFSRRRYPRQIVTRLDSGIAWILGHLGEHESVPRRIEEMASSIQNGRARRPMAAAV